MDGRCSRPASDDRLSHWVRTHFVYCHRASDCPTVELCALHAMAELEVFGARSRQQYRVPFHTFKAIMRLAFPRARLVIRAQTPGRTAYHYCGLAPATFEIEQRFRDHQPDYQRPPDPAPRPGHSGSPWAKEEWTEFVRFMEELDSTTFCHRETTDQTDATGIRRAKDRP